MSYMGKSCNARVFLRLLMFDRQLDVDKLNLKNKPTTAMAAKIADVNRDSDDTILYDREKYIFITNKQAILEYSQQIADMLNANAYWVKNLNLEDLRDRIESAKRVIMVLDKTNDIPCGFGRLFMMAEDYELEDTMGYLNDVVVESNHHRKGLGWAITNYLLGIKEEGINETLCLTCVNEGSGAVSAPKIYKKAGFELVSRIGNRIALFDSEEHFSHH